MYAIHYYNYMLMMIVHNTILTFIFTVQINTDHAGHKKMLLILLKYILSTVLITVLLNLILFLARLRPEYSSQHFPPSSQDHVSLTVKSRTSLLQSQSQDGCRHERKQTSGHVAGGVRVAEVFIVAVAFSLTSAVLYSEVGVRGKSELGC